MKKILFLGNNTHVDELIKFAKERGVYTIVTDNLPVEQSPFKAMADEAWDVSVLDYDVLEKKCKEEGINAILCGASEVCIKANKDLCERLGLPFYANQRAWDITNDKLAFKEACEACGLNVPAEYHLDKTLKAEDIAKIKYPVVVKPADGCSSIGLHICNNEEELKAGYLDAYEKSPEKKVVVEDFIAGEQVGFIYAVIKGEPHLFISGDDCACKDNSERRVFGATPTKHMDLFDKELRNQIDKLVEYLEIKDGIIGLQTIFDGSKFVALEMNYRLPGGKVPGEKYLCDVMLDNALNEDTKPTFTPQPGQVFSYALWLNPGKIADIQGVDVLQSQPQKYNVQLFRHVGDDVEENSGMRQILGYVMFFTDLEHHLEYTEEINNTVKVISDSGEDLLIHYRFEEGYAVL
ncbi:Carbamoylphosphate synthase large subunit [Pseudobutyrivibrio sp. YE44]|uniref:ATP-grasp domain-containing protein n=1 Tax=Pseudobutyrivibrio sp. YE44 TaxID=1520802 RepID=UPI0008868F25|nr:ATP-grasp domain-containing protein [Pseudobutyrivibrio sp. YE44]SDB46523.1 Carbamoylphosphate synthase large subunit [Pseudobutyrivibrio sp. YE44]